MIRKTKVFLLIFLWLFTAQAFSQQEEENESLEDIQSNQSASVEKVFRYVTDTLRLSMNSEANATSDRVKLLTSGDRLEIGEVSGAYVFVTTEQNLSGWVKSLFLDEKPTASFLIKEETAKNALLIEEMKKLNDSKQVIDKNEKQIARLKKEKETLTKKKKSLSKELESVKGQMAERDKIIEQEKQQKGMSIDWLVLLKIYWKQGLLAILLLFSFGFLTGKLTAEARIKKKFQGIKVW